LGAGQQCAYGLDLLFIGRSRSDDVRKLEQPMDQPANQQIVGGRLRSRDRISVSVKPLGHWLAGEAAGDRCWTENVSLWNCGCRAPPTVGGGHTRHSYVRPDRPLQAMV